MGAATVARLTEVPEGGFELEELGEAIVILSV